MLGLAFQIISLSLNSTSLVFFNGKYFIVFIVRFWLTRITIMPERKMGRLSARVLEATPKRPLSINGLEVLPMKSWEGLQVAPQRPSTEGLQVVIDSSLETAYDASPEVMYEKAAENPPGKKRLLTSKFRGIGLLWIVIAAFILVTSVVVLGVIVAKKNSHNNSSQATHTR